MYVCASTLLNFLSLFVPQKTLSIFLNYESKKFQLLIKYIIQLEIILVQKTISLFLYEIAQIRMWMSLKAPFSFLFNIIVFLKNKNQKIQIIYIQFSCTVIKILLCQINFSIVRSIEIYHVYDRLTVQAKAFNQFMYVECILYQISIIKLKIFSTKMCEFK